MTPGARTPEDLDALLEDAFVVRDRDAVSEMFERGAVVIAGEDPGQARGLAQIDELITGLWSRDRMYLSQPRRVVQARDTALVLADGGVSVMRRGRDGAWRFAIWLVSLEPTIAEEEP